jgi:hypothetical protein
MTASTEGLEVSALTRAAAYQRTDMINLAGGCTAEATIGLLGKDLSSEGLIVIWQTVYLQAAVDHLVANGHEPDPADIARLSPLGHPMINLQVRYRTTSRAPVSGLRPLRTAG